MPCRVVNLYTPYELCHCRYSEWRLQKHQLLLDHLLKPNLVLLGINFGQVDRELTEFRKTCVLHFGQVLEIAHNLLSRPLHRYYGRTKARMECPYFTMVDVPGFRLAWRLLAGYLHVGQLEGCVGCE